MKWVPPVVFLLFFPLLLIVWAIAVLLIPRGCDPAINRILGLSALGKERGNES